MGLGDRASRVVAFLRAGYPTWAPALSYIPLLALLPRRVTDEEIRAIVRRFRLRQSHPIDNADIGVEIARLTHEMPSLDDIERVQHRLAASEQPGSHSDPCGK
ncbi:DUF3349 domain-containing protein [Mycobacterium sp. Aquia_216]|uniref:DUF3349 domain-containing protein n=1 Tax=Mycobacterium sp. Aquia_216 TaxID=2991729 RepID=UPI00227BAFA5|nr:DUF3349 domain-containing protein [Mycobacterium sp. Aquia_216]WAJ46527.1 DUF3349 domain-containing protein [Mycobacterium sp. Aquia_216]